MEAKFYIKDDSDPYGEKVKLLAHVISFDVSPALGRFIIDDVLYMAPSSPIFIIEPLKPQPRSYIDPGTHTVKQVEIILKRVTK